MSDLKEKAQDYFERFKDSTECHITSDGRIFHTLGSAQSFATGLEDGTITSFSKSENNVNQIEVVGEVVVEGLEPGDNPDVITMAEVAAKENQEARSEKQDVVGENQEAESTEATEEEAASTEAASTEALKEEAPATTEATEEEAASTEALKEEAPASTEALTGDAKLLAFDTNTASYPELKAITAEFSIVTPSQKAVDLIEGIVAAQELLKNRS